MAEHHWGWLVAIYLFLGGMGAGAFLVASLVELTGKRYESEYCATCMVGAGVSGPLILIGTVLLIFDLGAGLREPWRILHMFTNFTSVMTWGIWILTLFLPIAFLYGLIEVMHVHSEILAWARQRLRFLPETLPYRRIKRVLCSVGVVLAVGTAIYTGVLLSVVQAVPLWNTPVLPALFLVSAISTGAGLSIDLTAALVVPEEPRRFKNLPLIHMLIIGLEIALLALLLVLALNQGGEAAESANLLLRGDQMIIFWALVIGLGMILPFLVHGYDLVRRRHSYVAGVLSGAGVVLAGLFIRYLIVTAAIPMAV
ncbi:MAG: polysulfide reductase NrfD [Anaerolineae bacterium]|jgi:formate-dependent nitrite reductase membrane component NrfD